MKISRKVFNGVVELFNRPEEMLFPKTVDELLDALIINESPEIGVVLLTGRCISKRWWLGI